MSIAAQVFMLKTKKFWKFSRDFVPLYEEFPVTDNGSKPRAWTEADRDPNLVAKIQILSEPEAVQPETEVLSSYSGRITLGSG